MSIENLIFNKVKENKLKALTFDQIMAVMQAAPQAHKDKFVLWVQQGGKSREIGEGIEKAVRTTLEAEALTETQTLIGDAMTLGELRTILGVA